MAESYNRNPPAPTRFIEGQPVVPPIPVEFRWPTIAEVDAGDVTERVARGEPVTTPRAWSLTISLPTSTVNGERSGDKWVHRRATEEYLKASIVVIRNARLPRLDRIAVEATPFGPRIRQDVGACFPSTKAAIDGLVKARVLPNDTPDHVCSLLFHQPRRGPHGLHLLIVDLADLPPDFGSYQARLLPEMSL